MSEEQNPTSYNRPNRPILEDADMNGLGQAIITLTKEIWVLTDRLHVMEAVMAENGVDIVDQLRTCLLYTSPSPRDRQKSRMPSSA